ncbi:MAG: hypothetical protein IT581_14595 [Verrucomicrobiales bacterium]|nr:hypothetical protein [Verrucomicrobiales bacterium]
METSQYRHQTTGRRWGWALLTAACIPAALGQALVKNPSFESNLNDETEPLSPGAPQGWPYYGSIDDWTAGGGGVNDLVYDAGGPFHNAGTPVPDGRRIGFKQGSGTISQDISGLTAGKRYWIQFQYDARNGSDLDLAVRFSTTTQGGAMDETLDVIQKPRPAKATGSPYYTRTVPFTPDFSDGTLTFEMTARGDSTILLDAVTLVQRDDGNFPVLNPSFEASGVVYDGSPTAGTDWPAIGGWSKTGVAGVDDGTGGKADNGKVPDQALVTFIEGEGSLTQNLAPLVAGDTYTVQFAYNAKSGTTPHLQLKVGGAVVWEQDVTPVGGTAAYRTASATFKPTTDTTDLSFVNTAAGGTVLLDDVKVLGKQGSRLPPLEMAPAKILLRGGEEGEVAIVVPAERLALGPATLKLRSANTAIFTLPEAGADGLVTLNFTAGNNRKTVKVRASAVGSGSVELTETAGLLLPTDITTVFVAGSTLVLNPSFELDKDSSVGSAPVTGWTTSGGNIGMAETGNPFLGADDLGIPDRSKVLRVQNGGTVSQRISGLQAGKLYGLQVFYNGRSSGYPYQLSLAASFDGKELWRDPEVKPAAQDGLAEYRFVEIRFTPTTAAGLLEFKANVTQGDATVFLDAISIIPRLEGEITVKNSSFEGTSMGLGFPGYIQPSKVAGWEASGGGYGVNAYSPKTYFIEPFLDNGINTDQDHAFFGQGAVKIAQTIGGLTAGRDYTLVFDYNYRHSRPAGSTLDPSTGQVEVAIDGSIVLTTDEALPVDTFLPWAGFRHVKPFYQAFIPVTAGADSLQVQIAHAGVSGDETYLIDNVRLVPGKRVPPTISTALVDQSVSEGAPATFTVAGGGTGLTYRWFLDGVLLADRQGLSGTATTKLTLASAKTTDAGTYSVLVSDGVGVVGSSAELQVEATPDANVQLAIGRAAGGALRISWPTSATGFGLTSAADVAGPYSPESNPAIVEADQTVVLVSPGSAARFYRLAK